MYDSGRLEDVLGQLQARERSSTLEATTGESEKSGEALWQGRRASDAELQRAHRLTKFASLWAIAYPEDFQPCHCRGATAHPNTEALDRMTQLTREWLAYLTTSQGNSAASEDLSPRRFLSRDNGISFASGSTSKYVVTAGRLLQNLQANRAFTELSDSAKSKLTSAVSHLRDADISKAANRRLSLRVLISGSQALASQTTTALGKSYQSQPELSRSEPATGTSPPQLQEAI